MRAIAIGLEAPSSPCSKCRRRTRNAVATAPPLSLAGIQRPVALKPFLLWFLCHREMESICTEKNSNKMEKLTLKSGRFQRIRAPGREYAPPIANGRRFPGRARHAFGKDAQKRALNAFRTTRPFFHPLFIERFSRKSGKFFAKERSKSQWPRESRPEEPMGWNRRPERQRTQRTEESGRQRPESRKAKGQRKPEGPRKVRGTEGWQRRSPSRQNQRRQTGF